MAQRTRRAPAAHRVLSRRRRTYGSHVPTDVIDSLYEWLIARTRIASIFPVVNPALIARRSPGRHALRDLLNIRYKATITHAAHCRLMPADSLNRMWSKSAEAVAALGALTTFPLMLYAGQPWCGSLLGWFGLGAPQPVRKFGDGRRRRLVDRGTKQIGLEGGRSKRAPRAAPTGCRSGNPSLTGSRSRGSGTTFRRAACPGRRVCSSGGRAARGRSRTGP